MKTQFPNSIIPSRNRGTKLQLSMFVVMAGFALVGMALSPLVIAGEIHEAVKTKEVARVKTLLAANAQLINAKDEGDHTPLHWAASSGQVDLAKFLLDAHADVNARSKGGATPLISAAHTGNADVVSLFLDAKADLALRDQFGQTALFWALYYRHQKVVDLLRQRGATDDDTLVFVAVAGKVEKLEALLKANPGSVDKGDDSDKTALHWAAASGQTAAAELLLTHQAVVDAQDRQGFTPLHLAVFNGRQETVELLLAHRAEVNARDRWGNPPLQYASDPEIIKTLRSHGAFGRPRDFGRNFIRADEDFLNAIQLGDADRVKQILRANPAAANALQDPQNRWSVLHEAATEGRVEIVGLLLEQGADPNVTNKDEETPLLWAVRKGFLEVAEALLKNKADPNIADANKRTPLHQAAFLGQTEIVELLLTHKADVSAKDAKGKTALFYATEEKNEEIAALLRKAGAKE